MIAHYTYFIRFRDARAAALDAWTPPDPLEAGGTSGTGSNIFGRSVSFFYNGKEQDLVLYGDLTPHAAVSQLLVEASQSRSETCSES